MIDPEQLAIVAPREPRPFWAFAEIVYDHGPIAGVLFYDEYPVDPPGDGAGDETAASIVEAGLEHRGWLFWPVGEEISSAAEDPWRPRIYVFGSRVALASVLRRTVATLEDLDPPIATYEESADLVTAMLEVEDPEYVLVPASSAVPTGSGRA